MSQAKELTCWTLENPRGHCGSASITFDGELYWVSCYITHTNHYDSWICKTLKGAKASFALRVLSKRYHGPNIWKEGKIKL